MELGHKIKQLFDINDIPRLQKASKKERDEAREFQEQLERNRRGEEAPKDADAEAHFSADTVHGIGQTVFEGLKETWREYNSQPRRIKSGRLNLVLLQEEAALIAPPTEL